jgi:small GTP-binding protein
MDQTARIWEISSGRCVYVLKGHHSTIRSAAWSEDQKTIITADDKGVVRHWDVSAILQPTNEPSPIEDEDERPAYTDIQYTNAKVLLVGESGAGKTGLSKVLAGEVWAPTDSTVGAWATQWNISASANRKIEREVWLWDFGGQADQRLIHQLYMDETALAVLVFDGQREDVFETLSQWDRDIVRATGKQIAKLLVAGRTDAGGLRTSRSQLENFRRERKYVRLIETSAKTGSGCEELKELILGNINWDSIPCRTTRAIFQVLKDEIVRLKDQGRTLLRVNELREILSLRLSGTGTQFSDADLKSVVTLLAGPGVVWQLKFGSWVLLKPESINAYGQAVIQTMRLDHQERGCIQEDRVLRGDLEYHASMTRLPNDEERFVLLAMHQLLVERGLCLREQTNDGPLLIFPSYYRRERPPLADHPATLVSYRFNGLLDEIYATLVVRLHHSAPFQQDELWRYAADFKTLTDKQLGVKLTRLAEGGGKLDVYFNPTISLEEKIIFSKYVHEHLLKNATDVVRLRHYVCPHCRTPVRDSETAMERLAAGGKKSSIVCVKCEKRVPLWDDLEERFAAPEVRGKIAALEIQSQLVLDNTDKERTLVGEVISTVALAKQIARELTIADNGIDMEIEFKDDYGNATGRKVYLQLKSGDSYLKSRKKDGAEIFKISKRRHAEYWRDQAFPVFLVIRNSDGVIRWMEIRDYLIRESVGGKKDVRQIVFEGSRFDVMSVRRWRDASIH